MCPQVTNAKINAGDSIAIWVDMKAGILCFYLNGEKVGSSFKDTRLTKCIEQGVKLYPAISLGGDHHIISLDWGRCKKGWYSQDGSDDPNPTEITEVDLDRVDNYSPLLTVVNK